MPHARFAIVLFDGTCAFCDRTVRLLSKLDRREALRFVPLQSEAAAYLLDRYAVPDSVDSIVLIYHDQALVHSDAAIATARLLGFPWSLGLALKVIPRSLRDAAYRLFARNRYRIFGRVEHCSLPTEAQRRVVLETREEAQQALAT